MKFKDFLTEATGELWGFYEYSGSKDSLEALEDVRLFNTEKEAAQYMAKYLVNRYAKDYMKRLSKDTKEEIFEHFKEISNRKDALSFLDIRIEFSHKIYLEDYPIAKLKFSNDKITSLD